MVVKLKGKKIENGGALFTLFIQAMYAIQKKREIWGEKKLEQHLLLRSRDACATQGVPPGSTHVVVALMKGVVGLVPRA